MKRYFTALSIAGLDPSGGAGLLADVKTFSALGVYGMAAATALTVQNTLGVARVVPVDAQDVYAQVAAVMSDIRPAAVKIGMVNDSATVEAIASVLADFRPRWVVLDPILLSSSGKALMEESALSAFVEHLLPLASVVTPNIPEAKRLAEACGGETLSSFPPPEKMASAIMSRGASAVLIKGGHAEGDEKVDRLYIPRKATQTYSAPTVVTRNTHGTGCTLSSAIAAYLARGCVLPEAVAKAKAFLTRALREGADVQVGLGSGSMNHLFAPEPLRKL